MPDPYSQLAQEVLDQPHVMADLTDWFDSDTPRSAYPFGESLGRLDADGKLSELLTSWLDEAKCLKLIAGYLRGLRTRSGHLPPEWGDHLDRLAVRHPEYAADLTLNADISPRGLQRVLRLVSGRVLKPQVLRAFATHDWSSALDSIEKARLLHAVLFFLDDDPTEFVALGLAIVAGWSNYGHDPLPESLLQPALQLLGATADVHVSPSDWPVLLELLAPSQPGAVVDSALRMLTSSRSGRVHVEDDALRILKQIAARDPDLVMDAVGQRLSDEQTRQAFSVIRFTGLFEAIGLAAVRRWVTVHGSDTIRHIARHVDSPYLDHGRPILPPLTEWILQEFGEDPEVIRDFCLGRHQLEIREGHARDRRAALEQEMRPFLSHTLPAVRQWAEYELKENEWEAAMDDRSDERLERL